MGRPTIDPAPPNAVAMNLLAFLPSALAGLVICVVGWLGWQLLQQNGRLLLRVEELERRLDELEFDEPDSHQSEESGVQSEGSRATNGDGRADRFSRHSLARSRIKRNGLKAGTPAPDFTLPRLDDQGEFSLEEFCGRRVLLVFSDPHCGPCNALAPELEKFHREQMEREVGRVTPCALPGGESSQNGAQGTARPTLGPTVVMISRGELKENRAKVKEHGLTFPVLLQQQWEISRRYAMFATPIAYLIDEAGIITHDVAVGVDTIVALMQHTVEPRLLAERSE